MPAQLVHVQVPAQLVLVQVQVQVVPYLLAHLPVAHLPVAHLPVAHLPVAHLLTQQAAQLVRVQLAPPARRGTLPLELTAAAAVVVRRQGVVQWRWCQRRRAGVVAVAGMLEGR